MGCRVGERSDDTIRAMTSNDKNHNDKKMDGRCSTENILFGGGYTIMQVSRDLQDSCIEEGPHQATETPSLRKKQKKETPGRTPSAGICELCP